MKITIITPTYNSSKTLRYTFDSILRQTHQDYEILVVDGKSKDDTLLIVKEYENKFDGRMRWISEPDKGIYDAMNKGIAMATGDVIGILNSDDFYFDDYVLEKVENSFTKYNTDCIFANLVYVNANDTSVIERVWKGSDYKDGRFKYGWAPAHPTFYVKRECYERYGVYDLSYQVSADFELMLRFIAKHKVSSKYIDQYFVRMRSGGESNGTIRNIILGNRNIIRAFNENGIKSNILSPVFRLFPKVVQLAKIKCMNKLNIKPKL